MSNETKKKYKVLLPTNGYGAGDTIELTEAEATGINANELQPRVEEVKAADGGEEAGAAAPQGTSTAPEAQAIEESTPADGGEEAGASEEGAGEGKKKGKK